jgi:hypothetical protein
MTDQSVFWCYDKNFSKVFVRCSSVATQEEIIDINDCMPGAERYCEFLSTESHAISTVASSAKDTALFFHMGLVQQGKQQLSMAIIRSSNLGYFIILLIPCGKG